MMHFTISHTLVETIVGDNANTAQTPSNDLQNSNNHKFVSKPEMEVPQIVVFYSY